MLTVYTTVARMVRAAKTIHPESVEAISARLIATREAMKLTQAAFSRLTGIEPQALNNYEKGFRRISIDQALKVCRKTGVSLDWIYRGLSSGLPVNLATTMTRMGVEEYTQ